MVEAFTQWRRRVLGAPTRALTRRLAAHLSSAVHDGVALTVTDPSCEAYAPRFFSRTAEGLMLASTRAPGAYRAFHDDVRSVTLRRLRPSDPLYHPFQLAVVISPALALEGEIERYAAWLLFASGLARHQDAAMARAQEFLETLAPEQREAISEWIRQTFAALSRGDDAVDPFTIRYV